MALTFLLLIVLVTFTIDQVTKIFLMNYRFDIIPGLLENAPIMNDGAAFSSLKGERVFFIIFTTLALIVLVFLLLTKKWSNHPLYKSTIALMIGGVLGNFVDRIVFGAVRDFIFLPPLGFVCNVADIAITAACIMFAVYIFFYSTKDEDKRKKMKIKEEANSLTQETKEN